MTKTLTYGSMELNPVIWTHREAWWFVNGRWHELLRGALLTKAYKMTEAEFDKEFGQLPALPVTAFQASGRAEITWR